MISVTYGLLKEEDIYDNRLEIMANLKVMKEKIENKNGLKDLNSNTMMKNATDFNFNESSTNSNSNSNSNNNEGPVIANNCNAFLDNNKEFKEIENNLEFFNNELQNQVNNIKLINNKENHAELNDDGKKNNYEDKDIQTEKSEEEEYDKLKFEYEREMRILQLQIEDKTNEIDYLNAEIEELENENKNLKKTIPYDEKGAREKMDLLNENLKDLMKKLERCQYYRLETEDRCNKYIKSMKEKNEIIHNLEKEIKELKENNNSNNQSNVINVVKKITGGMN